MVWGSGGNVDAKKSYSEDGCDDGTENDHAFLAGEQGNGLVRKLLIVLYPVT